MEQFKNTVFILSILGLAFAGGYYTGWSKKSGEYDEAVQNARINLILKQIPTLSELYGG